MTNQQQYSGQDRRNGDTVLSMMREQISSLGSSLAETNKSLTDHVSGCVKSQKWTIILIAITLIWIICHSPEANRLAERAFPSFPTFGAP